MGGKEREGGGKERKGESGGVLSRTREGEIMFVKKKWRREGEKRGREEEGVCACHCVDQRQTSTETPIRKIKRAFSRKRLKIIIEGISRKSKTLQR